MTAVSPPLLVVCALGIERLALYGGRGDGPGAGRGDGWGDARPPVILRTGMGPHAAERAMAKALGPGSRTAHSPVLATGFCAGLAPGIRPGDVVVAEAVRDHRADRPDRPDIPCHDNAPLLHSLRAQGLTVHTGLLHGSDHVVRGPERDRLRRSGAVAVDMESAAALGGALRAGPRRVAAVRVVVDAPGHELVRIGTVRGGVSAFRVLRAVLPVFVEWHRSLLLPRR